MLAGVILPIFFIVILGFILRRLGRVDEKVFSRTQLYILSPALIFAALTRHSTGIPVLLQALLFIAILTSTLFAVAQAAGFMLGENRVTRNALSLASMFSNSGFYGIPVCMLAFGDEGVMYAAIFVAGSSAMQSTLGIYTASAGRSSPARALKTVFRVPMLYSIVLAKALLHLDLLPPEPFMKMINLLGNSAIPLGLLLLGMQLESIISGILSRKRRREETPEASQMGRRAALLGSAAAVIKLAGGFAAALILVRIFDFSGTMEKVFIVEAAMPTAVNAVVFATEFDCRPEVVTVGILVSTLASILTITLVLGFLGA
ncbi:MAG: AEC family transporter [Candidatus Krumholzibacteriales bacterium]